MNYFKFKNLIIHSLQISKSLFINKKLYPSKQTISTLKSLNVELVEHLNDRSLYKHLLGTYSILKKWEEPESICLGGLYHSIYGTYNFATSTLIFSQRHKVQSAIGLEAEKLVFYFCIEDRKHFYSNYGNFNQVEKFTLKNRLTTEEVVLTYEEFKALLTLHLADHLEQLPYTRDYRYKDFYLKLKPFLNPKAFKDFARAYGLKLSTYRN